MFFSYKHLKLANNRDDVVLSLCEGKRVLHIGAADSPLTLSKLESGLLLHKRLTDVADEVLGIDIDQEMVEVLRERGFENIQVFDMDHVSALEFDPDVIVFGETLEHLMNLEHCLTTLRRVMRKNTKLIISTPNCFHLYFISMVARNFEAIHDDHKVGFTYGLLNQLLRANGLALSEFYFTFLPREQTRWFEKLWRVVARFRKGFAETLLAVCVLSDGDYTAHGQD